MLIAINYIEIPVKDIALSKQFFQACFEWQFTDYGDDYCSIDNAGIGAGLYTSDLTVSVADGSVLMVLYSEDLEHTQNLILQNKGKIIQPVFSFPGGRRFHFVDINNNEYAVWSDK